MQKSTFNSLIKHSVKIEKDIARISRFQEKGCATNTLLNEVFMDLRNLGDYLNNLEDKDDLYNEINAKYNCLLREFDNIANQVSPESEGKVMASDNYLPEFVERITSRNQAVWLCLERITTAFGIGMVAFTLFGMTYFLIAGSIPFFKTSGGLPSGIIAVVFLVGLILGLLVHEFAHAVVLANNGIKVKRMGLMAGSMIGGFVEADEDTFLKADPKVHLRFNASSIGTNAFLALILIIIGLLVSSDIFIYLALGNLFFGFINSFPISPMDGGWVYEDIVKLYVKNIKIKKILLGARFVFFMIWIILFTRLVLILA